jgi:hypothetical protein
MSWCLYCPALLSAKEDGFRLCISLTSQQAADLKRLCGSAGGAALSKGCYLDKPARVAQAKTELIRTPLAFTVQEAGWRVASGKF